MREIIKSKSQYTKLGKDSGSRKKDGSDEFLLRELNDSPSRDEVQMEEGDSGALDQMEDGGNGQLHQLEERGNGELHQMEEGRSDYLHSIEEQGTAAHNHKMNLFFKSPMLTTCRIRDSLRSVSSTSSQNGSVPSASNNAWEQASNFFEYDPNEHEMEDELGFIDPSSPPIPGWNLKYMQWRVRRFVEHFTTRLFTAVLIIVDTVVLIIDVFNPPQLSSNPYEFSSLAFSTYFMIEIGLRIFALGPRYFFYAWYNLLDFLLVVITFNLSIIAVSVENAEASPASLIVVLRFVRLIRIARIFWQRRHLQTGARQFISQNKRRYQKDGFDLDLTYVAPRIIAMSFPSSGRMSMYRNDIKEVSRFLDTKHPGHYKVYNLCSERHYDEAFFHGCVERFKIDDHNVPTVAEMLKFSEDVKKWLDADPDNVIAVHCKGGKGRTGTMICVVLIDSQLFKDAHHCLGYFGERRTDKNAGRKFQGVETPSQSRYVGYYEQVVRANRQLPADVPLFVKGITVRSIKTVGSGDGSEFTITISSKQQGIPFEAVLESGKNCITSLNKETDELYIDLINSPLVKGDTKLMFYSKGNKIPKGYDKCAFFFWCHTSFIRTNKLTLHRHELDNPHKPVTWSSFNKNFSVTVYFQPEGQS